MLSGIFFWVGNSAWDFLGFDFWPHSIIPVTWNPEYPPPDGAKYTFKLLGLCTDKFITQKQKMNHL